MRFCLPVAVGIVVILAVGLGWQRRENHRLRVAAENTRKAQELKSAIDRRFPVGTSEADVATFLQNQHSGYTRFQSGNRTEYRLPVGDEPSDEWYCGSWTRGVKLRFESGRLVLTNVDRWSADCI